MIPASLNVGGYEVDPALSKVEEMVLDLLGKVPVWFLGWLQHHASNHLINHLCIPFVLAMASTVLMQLDFTFLLL